MATAGAIRPLLAGVAGGVGGVLITQLLSQNKGVSPVADVTFEEPPRNILASGRAGEILKFGAPKEVMEPLVYKNHVLAYDSARRVPKWVAEHLSKDVASREQVANRKGVNFVPDPTVPKEFSSDNRDYWGSGWSRGHMAPAGNNKHCQESMNQTFFYTNVVPQDLDNNGNYWNRLEIWCRNLVKQYQDVWITSGPLWLPIEEPSKEEENTTPSDRVADKPSGDADNANTVTKKTRKVRPPRPAARQISYPVIGPNQVSVPTHLYKVVVVSDPSLVGPQLAAFVVPNKPVENVPLTEFQVTLNKLERELGLIFHPGLDRSTVGDLCKHDGCHLQNYKEFQQFFWNRRLSSPWNLGNLEKDWAEATRKGVVTPALKKVYLESKEKLILKEKEKNNPAVAA